MTTSRHPLRISVLLLPLALAAALLAPAAAAQQGPPPETIEKIAQGICKAERAKLGDKEFAAKYGSDAACAAAKAGEAEDVVQSAIADCRGAAAPGSPEFKTCVQDAIKKAIGGGSGGGAEGAAKLAGNIADGLCKAEQKKLGREKFDAKYGSHEACKSALADKAAALAKEAGAKCKDAADKQACTKALLESRLKPADGAVPAELSAGFATALCKVEEKKLGAERFEDKYGSQAACKSALAGKAEALAKEAFAKCKGEDDKKACTKSFMESKLKSGSGGGAQLSQLTETVAAALCKVEEKKLGAREFEQKHGDAAGCKKAMGDKAAALAKEIAAGCKDAEDKKACTKAAIEKRLKSGAKAKK